MLMNIINVKEIDKIKFIQHFFELNYQVMILNNAYFLHLKNKNVK